MSEVTLYGLGDTSHKATTAVGLSSPALEEESVCSIRGCRGKAPVKDWCFMPSNQRQHRNAHRSTKSSP